MAEIRGTPKEQISYKIPSDILSKIDKAIADGVFNNRSDVITAGLRFYFDNRDKPSGQDQFKTWIVSEDGETFMKGLIVKYRKEK